MPRAAAAVARRAVRQQWWVKRGVLGRRLGCWVVTRWAAAVDRRQLVGSEGQQACGDVADGHGRGMSSQLWWRLTPDCRAGRKERFGVRDWERMGVGLEKAGRPLVMARVEVRAVVVGVVEEVLLRVARRGPGARRRKVGEEDGGLFGGARVGRRQRRGGSGGRGF